MANTQCPADRLHLGPTSLVQTDYVPADEVRSVSLPSWRKILPGGPQLTPADIHNIRDAFGYDPGRLVFTRLHPVFSEAQFPDLDALDAVSVALARVEHLSEGIISPIRLCTPNFQAGIVFLEPKVVPRPVGEDDSVVLRGSRAAFFATDRGLIEHPFGEVVPRSPFADMCYYPPVVASSNRPCGDDYWLVAASLNQSSKHERLWSPVFVSFA